MVWYGMVWYGMVRYVCIYIYSQLIATSPLLAMMIQLADVAGYNEEKGWGHITCQAGPGPRSAADLSMFFC